MMLKVGIAVLVIGVVSAFEAPKCSCPVVWAPVCGSDGQTYATSCFLECKQQQDPSLTIASQGKCQVNKELYACACPLIYAPVCGSDGKTYPTLCALNCNKDQHPGLRMVSHGTCSTKAKVEHPCICTLDYRPVCGSDGKTYSNLCALNCAANTKFGLMKVRDGECGHEFQVDMAVCACTREYRPVCGSDGKTYPNPCVFNCAAKDNEGLTAEHKGMCNEVKAKVQHPCVCTFDYRPVCGSDGKTYPNLCTLNCAANNNNGLMKVRDGECGHDFQVDMAVCACSREYRPVCGSDGKTYPNPCVFNCAAKDNEGLTTEHTGMCNEVKAKVQHPCFCTFDYRPVCGSDGKTYPNLCTLNCAANNNNVLNKVHDGECAQTIQTNRPVCKCTKEYNPVCGSDGKTYGNPCTLRCEQATHNSALKMYHMGQC